jgi:ADP-heptose:LPS heptosyltransferase
MSLQRGDGAQFPAGWKRRPADNHKEGAGWGWITILSACFLSFGRSRPGRSIWLGFSKKGRNVTSQTFGLTKGMTGAARNGSENNTKFQPMFEYCKLFYYLIRPRTVFLRRISNALGDNLLLTALLPGLREKKPEHKVVVETPRPEIFLHNPYVAWVTTKHLKTTRRHIKPKYRVLDGTEKSFIEQMRAYIGWEGRAVPQLYLSEAEKRKARQRFPFPYFAIAPTGKSGFSANRKEWGIDNFQHLLGMLADLDLRAVQVGLAGDPLLAHVEDARGLSLRETAAVIDHAELFLGLEGGLMHLAKSVGKPSVIIYGGYIRPQISGYADNLNIYQAVHCSPCYTSESALADCPTMICMRKITPAEVFDQISRFRKMLGRQDPVQPR